MANRILVEEYYARFCPEDGTALEKMHAPRAITGGKKYYCLRCRTMYSDGEVKEVLDREKLNLRLRENFEEQRVLGKMLDDSLKE